MKSHFLYRGAKIAYCDKGKGRTIVLIHGFLGAKEIWKDYQNRLSKSFRVVTLDLPGHGDSECIGYVHSMELLAETVRELLNNLNIRKAVVVGHSLGGYVSLAFAEKYPDSVLGLTLINSSAKGDSKNRVKSRNQLIKLVKVDKSKAVDLLVPSLFSVKTRTTHWKIKKYMNVARKCSRRGIIATVEGMMTRKEREIILKFAPFPYLYLIGKQDPIFDVDELSKEAKIGDRGYFKILENASHMSIMEENESVFRYLKKFANKLSIQ